jgi:hypothetical protein
MVHGVLGALLSAGFADVGAYLTHRVGKLASARHVSGCQATDLRTINIELDAAPHTSYIAFFKAGHGATVAGRRAGVARVNA